MQIAGKQIDIIIVESRWKAATIEGESPVSEIVIFFLGLSPKYRGTRVIPWESRWPTT